MAGEMPSGFSGWSREQWAEWWSTGAGEAAATVDDEEEEEEDDAETAQHQGGGGKAKRRKRKRPKNRGEGQMNREWFRAKQDHQRRVQAEAQLDRMMERESLMLGEAWAAEILAEEKERQLAAATSTAAEMTAKAEGLGDDLRQAIRKQEDLRRLWLDAEQKVHNLSGMLQKQQQLNAERLTDVTAARACLEKVRKDMEGRERGAAAASGRQARPHVSSPKGFQGLQGRQGDEDSAPGESTVFGEKSRLEQELSQARKDLIMGKAGFITQVAAKEKTIQALKTEKEALANLVSEFERQFTRRER
ncbi:unnamed protein product [Symbiodinium necroappetens]|uniref:Uncharacterized protein n=1 Tax=Symbiodinium necroappetens TaxID=1628268 RepID=A0A812YB59_9DINO|nr:unnamed protein product [Symbiodinium necroappetens]